jgi:hypothetical protein
MQEWVCAGEGEARLAALTDEANAMRSAQSNVVQTSQQQLATEALERRSALQALRDAHSAEVGVIRTKASALEETVASLTKERATMAKQLSELRAQRNGAAYASPPPATPPPLAQEVGVRAAATPPSNVNKSFVRRERSAEASRSSGLAEAAQQRPTKGASGEGMPRTPALGGHSGDGDSPLMSTSTGGGVVINFEEGSAIPISQQVCFYIAARKLRAGAGSLQESHGL